MMLAVTLAKPRYSASFSALRSMARLAATRTRLSCHGDFGSHCSVKTTHSVNVGDDAFSVRPGVRFTSSASAPRSE